jgi:hypothetical protein
VQHFLHTVMVISSFIQFSFLFNNDSNTSFNAVNNITIKIIVFKYF